MASRRKPRPGDSAEPSKDSTSVALEPQCTLRECIALKAMLGDALALGSDVQLDGSAVQRIDTAGLQLLVAFARAAATEGHAVRWQAASPELLAVATQLGLAGALGLVEQAA